MLLARPEVVLGVGAVVEVVAVLAFLLVFFFVVLVAFFAVDDLRLRFGLFLDSSNIWSAKVMSISSMVLRPSEALTEPFVIYGPKRPLLFLWCLSMLRMPGFDDSRF